MKKNDSVFDYHKNFQDLVFCSDELLYFTAHLYLYRPHITNPVSYPNSIGDLTIYQYNISIPDRRYLMFLDVAGQAVYNYWDRIGGLITSFFPDKIKNQRSIYFVTSLGFVPTELHSEESYIWLKNFSENEYKDLNGKRKSIVHYTSSSTVLRHKYLQNITNQQETQTIYDEHFSLADYYKNHISLSLEGFEKVVHFLEKVIKE